MNVEHNAELLLPFIYLCLIHPDYSSIECQDLWINNWKRRDWSCCWLFHVQRLATGWTGRGSNPSGGQIFGTRPDRLWDPPSLLYNGHPVSFLGVKRPGRGVDHHHHPNL